VYKNAQKERGAKNWKTLAKNEDFNMFKNLTFKKETKECVWMFLEYL
jgi:hypothetical protein